MSQGLESSYITNFILGEKGFQFENTYHGSNPTSHIIRCLGLLKLLFKHEFIPEPEF